MLHNITNSVSNLANQVALSALLALLSACALTVVFVEYIAPIFIDSDPDA